MHVVGGGRDEIYPYLYYKGDQGQRDGVTEGGGGDGVGSSAARMHYEPPSLPMRRPNVDAAATAGHHSYPAPPPRDRDRPIAVHAPAQARLRGVHASAPPDHKPMSLYGRGVFTINLAPCEAMKRIVQPREWRGGASPPMTGGG